MDSGLTAVDFAAESGINARTLTFWKWRLRRDGASGTEHATEQSQPAFVEVSAPTRTSISVPACTPTRWEPIEIVLREDVRIRVPAAFDADALRRVVHALEGR